MSLPIPIGPASVTINIDDRFVVCAPDGTIRSGAEEGFFARDARFFSGYRMWINEQQPVLLNSSAVQFFSSRFEFTNPPLIDGHGPIERHSLSIRLDRTVAGGVHEDYDIVNYGRRAVRLTIELETKRQGGRGQAEVRAARRRARNARSGSLAVRSSARR